jgi:hypothetical protein
LSDGSRDEDTCGDKGKKQKKKRRRKQSPIPHGSNLECSRSEAVRGLAANSKAALDVVAAYVREHIPETGLCQRLSGVYSASSAGFNLPATYGL